MKQYSKEIRKTIKTPNGSSIKIDVLLDINNNEIINFDSIFESILKELQEDLKTIIYDENNNEIYEILEHYGYTLDSFKNTNSGFRCITNNNSNVKHILEQLYELFKTRKAFKVIVNYDSNYKQSLIIYQD